MRAGLKVDVKRGSSRLFSGLLKGNDFCMGLPCPGMVTSPHNLASLDQNCSHQGIRGGSPSPLFRQMEYLLHPLLIRHQWNSHPAKPGNRIMPPGALPLTLPFFPGGCVAILFLSP